MVEENIEVEFWTVPKRVQVPWRGATRVISENLCQTPLSDFKVL